MKRGPYRDSWLWKFNQISVEQMKLAIDKSRSIRQVFANLNVPLPGGGYKLFKDFVDKHNLDVSNLKGKGWLKNLRGVNRISAEEILVYGQKRNRGSLKRSLLERGHSYECKICKQQPIHDGKELILPIDHIDGNPKNNVESNLRFLCPNCHTQTPTYGFKKRTSIV